MELCAEPCASRPASMPALGLAHPKNSVSTSGAPGACCIVPTIPSGSPEA
jgi:hypothetical protein